MKIAIIGYSGSGKSTLARRLGKHYQCEVLHLDSIHLAENWVERSDEEMIADAAAFMEKDGWIIDGNYSRVLQKQRFSDADRIIFMNFNRFACLARVCRRYGVYRGTRRPDMAEGCSEKLDFEFIRWILWEGRTAKMRARYRNTAETYPDKITVLRNQRELDSFMKELGIET